VITLSDVQWSYVTRSTAAPSDPTEKAFPLGARLDLLVEQELVAQEIEKEPLFMPPEIEVDRDLGVLETRYGGHESLLAEAEQSGLTLDQLRTIVRRQLTVKKFVDTRLRPFVVVLPEEIAVYYRETLAPRLKEQGISEPPLLDDVRAQIEQVLIEQKVDDELRKWIDTARRRSKITILLNREEPLHTIPDNWLRGKPR
jgi:hypothetical protein